MLEKVSGLNIEYNIIGSGKPVIILSNSEEILLEKVFARHAGYKRIYIHAPGTGTSEVADWMSSSDDVLQVLLRLIDRLLGDEKFLLIGFSYLSYLTQGIVRMRPEQADGIAMFYPVVHAEFNKRSLPGDKIVFRDEKFLRGLNPNTLEELSSFVVQNGQVLELCQELSKAEPSVYNADFYNKLKQTGRYALSFSVAPLPIPFLKPALIVLGRQDCIVGYRDGWQLIDSYPRATFSVLDMAGHSLVIEQNELSATLLSDWLKRCRDHENKIYTVCSL